MINVPSFSPNSNYPQLCDKVTVGYDEKKGRFIKATEDIPIGTVVCVEQGITVNVDPEKCYRCLRYMENDGFAYCKDCEDFYEPDEIACGEFDQLGIFKLASHLVFSYPFVEMATLVKSADPDLEVEKGGIRALSTTDISSVYQLMPCLEVGEAFKAPVIQEAIAKIVESLKNDENWGRLDDASRLMTFTKALRIMAERCVKNAHTIYSIEQVERKDEQIPTGTGLFPISSIFNHSCTPNVFGFFVQNTFIFVSRGVKDGDELVDSYGVSYNQHTFQQRKEFLESVSGFKCHCDSCFDMKSLDEELEKCSNDVDQCARKVKCLMDISEFLDYMPPGSKDIENLIVAFARREDSGTYTESMFKLWKTFLENAKVRGIVYDPYLVRPYVEMVLLAWNDDVECSDEEKASLLITTHRLLRNFYIDFHPLSQIITTLVDQSTKSNINDIRNTVERLKWRARSLWKVDEPNSSE